MDIIIGTSLVNHKKRIKLSLTVDQYITMLFIDESYQRKRLINEDMVYKHLGYRMVEFTVHCHFLRKHGYLNYNAYIPTLSWTKEFKDATTKFEEFWKILNTGNKQKAKDAYNKCLVAGIDEDRIIAGAKSYSKNKPDYQSFMHASSFLNHRNEEWNRWIELAEPKKEVYDGNFFAKKS